MEQRRNEWLRTLALVAVTVVMILNYGSIDAANMTYASWDLHNYRAMSSAAPALNANVPAPYTFRLLGPWIAGLLPGGVDQGFMLLTLLFAFFLPPLLDKWLRDRGVVPSLALVITLFFILNKHVFGFQVWNFYQANDLIGMTAILLALMALERGRLLAFSMVLAAGVFAKETVLLVAIASPFYVMTLPERPTQWRKIGLAVAPVILIYIALHLLVPHQGGRGLIEALRLHVHKLWSPEQLFRALANAFAPVSALFFVYPKEMARAVKRAPHLGILFAGTYASTLLGLDGERLMAPAFAAVAGLTADVFSTESRIRRLLPVLLILAVINGFQDVITQHVPALHGILGAIVFFVAILVALGNRVFQAVASRTP